MYVWNFYTDELRLGLEKWGDLLEFDLKSYQTLSENAEDGKGILRTFLKRKTWKRRS